MGWSLACSEYAVTLIRSLISGAAVPPVPSEISLEELFEFSKAHCVEAMVLQGLSQAGAESADPVWKFWRNRADLLLAQSAVQLADRDILLDALTEAGIELLPVKGCWLKELYPNISYRQMSDLDMLIHPADTASARSVMLGLGFRQENPEERGHHDIYKKEPYTAVELHLSLLSRNDPSFSYYDDVWQKARPVEGRPRLYRMPPEEEYIFCMLHLSKHLQEMGAGIRPFLDTSVLRSAFPGMNRAYISDTFRRLGLSGLAEQVETLSRCWFETGEPVPEPLRELAECILSGRQYGSLDITCQTRLQQLRKTHNGTTSLILAYWKERFLRPRGEMEQIYPILIKYPLLLPFFRVVRVVMKCIRKPKALWAHMKLVKEEASDHG